MTPPKNPEKRKSCINKMSQKRIEWWIKNKEAQLIKNEERRKLLPPKPKNYCIDCDKEIRLTSKRCHRCANNANPNRFSFQKGNVPWNANQTKETNPILKRFSEERLGKNNGSENGNYNRPHTPEERKLMSDSHWDCSGKNNPNWHNGSSIVSYGKGFNNQLKEQIRKRDNYRCQQCFREQSELRDKNNKHYKLSIHHIDYNKKNNSSENLISLCKQCHAQTNFSREDWQDYFKNKTKER